MEGGESMNMHIVEFAARRQAKEIFNNTTEEIDEHLTEELKELVYAVDSKDNEAIIDEAGDVLYMLNQKFETIGTDILSVLKKTIAKNEKKRKDGSNTI